MWIPATGDTAGTLTIPGGPTIQMAPVASAPTGPTQTPTWQMSLRVQAFPSLQEAPSVFVVCVHVPLVGLQAPTSWH
jgi:hypothetical protein